MSAAFYLTFGGKPIRMTGESSGETVAPDRATPFTSEAEAWGAAVRMGLFADQCAVTTNLDSPATIRQP